MKLASLFIFVGIFSIVGCSKDGGSSTASGGSPTAQTQGGANAGSAGAYTAALTDGTRTTMPDGSVLDTCSSQVLKDYELVTRASDMSNVDFMSEQSLNDFRARSESANATFSQKYPNIKCGYNDGTTRISICASTNSNIRCN